MNMLKPSPHKLQKIILIMVSLSCLTIHFFFAGRGNCQEIMLDKMVKCGDLYCFPTYDDNSTYYYLPDNPRLAMKNGRPQFSFLKYARLKETGKAGINRAEGGGIVHFLIEYGATPDRVARARAALQQINKKAKIAGPVMYRKARFALVTTFNEDNREFTKIATIGKAPVLEGQKAAVSISLTREGAEVLWESFKTATADITVSLEAEYEGIRNPYDATLIIDWAKVSKNHHIRAGGTYKWFGADLDILLRELKDEGAVSLVVKGKDTVMDAAWRSAQELAVNMMFQPIPLDEIIKQEVTNGKFPNLNRALALSQRSASLNQGLPLHATIHLNQYPEIMAALRALAADILGIPEAQAAPGESVSPGQQAGNVNYKQCIQLLKYAKQKGYPQEGCVKAINCFENIKNMAGLSPSRRKNIQKAIKLLNKKLDASIPAAERGGGGGVTLSPPSSEHGQNRRRIRKTLSKTGPIGLMVSYRMRQLKKTGKFVLNMKRYATSTRYNPMAGNLGDLYSRYGHDPKIFRAVLIDDPVYKQREILITLDGQDAETFKKHVNFVTVQMRKVHESGEITRDEIAITPDTFNSKANMYEFIYGYKGDTDRDAWLNYEARDIWSFAGDITIEHGWKQHNEAMLSVASPVRYRSISIEAEGERLTKAGVRHGVIELFSTINGKELREEVSIRNSGPAPIKVVDIPVTDEAAPEYVITWYLNDGSRIQGERQTLQGDILYWDIIKGEKK